MDRQGRRIAGSIDKDFIKWYYSYSQIIGGFTNGKWLNREEFRTWFTASLEAYRDIKKEEKEEEEEE